MDTILDPVSPQIGLYPAYCLDQATTLVYRRKKASVAGDAVVADLDGNEKLTCWGKAWSLHTKKVISDANGQVLYNTAKRPVRVPRRFWAEDADGKEIFTFKGTWKWNPRFTATLTNHFTSQETNVTVQRSGVMGAADIFLGDDDKGPVMARIFRDFWKKADLVGAHTFNILVAPGVDYSLVVALVMLFEQARDEDHTAAANSAAASSG